MSKADLHHVVAVTSPAQPPDGPPGLIGVQVPRAG